MKFKNVYKFIITIFAIISAFLIFFTDFKSLGHLMLNGVLILVVIVAIIELFLEKREKNTSKKNNNNTKRGGISQK